MAGLIKNQILKHLSKFTKNLSPDKIHVSTLKGEGDLSNLELDERVLTDLLDLPSWLRLTKAVCNRVSIKIQWTKLKSQPICLYLDEIVVEMDTCDILRNGSSDSPISSYSPGGKYGFAERIIDGMFVSINSVVVNFRAKAFAASIQLSRIIVQSKTPTWHDGDLRLTRVKDDLREEVLIFKEAEWQTLRIEANALGGSEPNLATTPLRLIANQSKIRITIKKRLIDCSVVASRLQVNLDDLLWVLTDSQLKAALVFVNSLRDIIKVSSEQSKRMAAEKLKKQGYMPSPVHGPNSGRPPGSKQPSRRKPLSELFNKFDIKETSYHLYTGRIDLHLCDDAAPEDENHRRKVEGGAMQVTLFKLAFDYYPYHPAGSDRTHWLKYDENMKARDQWAETLLSSFKEDVRRVKDAYTSPQSSPAHTTKQENAYSPSPSDGTGHANLAPPKVASNGGQTYAQGQRAGQGQIPRSNDIPRVPAQAQRGRPASLGGSGSAAPAPSNQNQGQGQGHNVRGVVPSQLPPPPRTPKQTKLLEACMVLRLEDFALYRVSTALDHKRSIPKKFMSSDKKQLLLPAEMSSVHMELTEYYFPEGIDFPEQRREGSNKLSVRENHEEDFVIVEGHDDDLDSWLNHYVPHANLFVLVNPIRITMDYLTILWLNAFALNLLKQADIPASEGPKVHMDMKMKILMPRLILPAEGAVGSQSDRPDGLQIQASCIGLTNVRIEPKTSRSDLEATLQQFRTARMFSGSGAGGVGGVEGAEGVGRDAPGTGSAAASGATAEPPAGQGPG